MNDPCLASLQKSLQAHVLPPLAANQFDTSLCSHKLQATDSNAGLLITMCIQLSCTWTK